MPTKIKTNAAISTHWNRQRTKTVNRPLTSIQTTPTIDKQKQPDYNLPAVEPPKIIATELGWTIIRHEGFDAYHQTWKNNQGESIGQIIVYERQVGKGGWTKIYLRTSQTIPDQKQYHKTLKSALFPTPKDQ